MEGGCERDSGGGGSRVGCVLALGFLMAKIQSTNKTIESASQEQSNERVSQEWSARAR